MGYVPGPASGGGAVTGSAITAAGGLLATTAAASFAPDARVYAVTNIDTLTKAQAWKAAGGTHVLVPFYWDRFQTSSGAALAGSALTEVRGWIANARAAGLRVIGEVNIASTPTWYQSAVPAFQQQGGTTYTATGIRDMIWSKTARTAIADFVGKVFAALAVDDLEPFDTFRVGGGPLGELSTPDAHFSGSSTVPDWWCYSAAAGGSADLADGMTSRPFTTTTYPFNATAGGTAGTAADVAGYEWYTRSVTTFMRWLVDQHRKGGWRGAVHVLLPSFGVRWAVGDKDTNNRFELAQGCDWRAHIDGFNDHNVFPWNTWANRQDNSTVNGEQDYSPSRYLAYLARQKGCDSFLMGENAAGASDAQATAMWADVNGPMQRGYRGVMWVSYDDLTGGISGKATLTNLTVQQATKPGAGRIKPTQILGTPTAESVQRRPADSGYLGWTDDPVRISSGNIVPTTGTFHVNRIRVQRGALSRGVQAYVTNVGVTLTSGYLALIDTAGNVVAVSADRSAAMGATGLLQADWVTPVRLSDDVYYVGFIATGTTGPGLSVLTNASSPGPLINVAAPGFKRAFQCATLPAAGPTFPASFDMTTLALVNKAFWYGLY